MRKMGKQKISKVFIRNFMVIACLIVMIFSAVTITYSNRMQENARNEVIENNYHELRRNGERLDSIIKQLRDCAYYISKAEEINMLNTFMNVDSRENRILSLKEKIGIYSRMYGYVDSLFVYMEKQELILDRNGQSKLSDMSDIGWLDLYGKTPERKGGQTCMLTARCKYDNYPYYMTIVYALYNGQDEKIGAVVMNLDMDELNDTIESNDNEEQLYLIDAEGNLMYASQSRAIRYPELLPEGFENVCQKCIAGEKIEVEQGGLFVQSMKSSATNGYYIFYSTDDFYKERIDLTMTYIKQNMVWTFLTCLLAAYVLALHTYRPIRFLMSEVEKEDDEFIEGSGKKDEIQYIAELIQNAKRKNKKMQLETKEWMEQLGHAQIQALQSQINPHFLYNTLDSINWLVIEKNGMDNEASKMIYSLAQLLRISMKRDSYLIPLEELEHVRLYLELINIRYANRIHVHWEVAEELKQIKVLRLCLQPIIENAVLHGLKMKKYIGDVYIKGDMVNTTLIIRVEDNGVGMDLDACLKMNALLNNNYTVTDNHVGIKNVNQRMKILFGEDYGIQLRPRRGGGTEVVMCFPGENMVQ